MHPYEVAPSETEEARRERMILEQIPQVNLIARRVYERLPGNVCLDDLISTGIVGLIFAIDSFDESYGVKLSTYAEYKIRGAILDSLRGMDWASRHRRKKAKDIEAAISNVEQRLKRAPTEDEVAKELDLTLEEYQARLTEIQGINLQSLEIQVGSSQQALLSMLPDASEELPSEALERSELERLLAKTIDAMPERERMVLALYYREGLTLKEIAGILDLHLSRVSEIKTQAILRLRAQMRRKWPTTRGR
jgi:RNA polymerase sigma factor FliA